MAEGGNGALRGEPSGSNGNSNEWLKLLASWQEGKKSQPKPDRAWAVAIVWNPDILKALDEHRNKWSCRQYSKLGIGQKLTNLFLTVDPELMNIEKPFLLLTVVGNGLSNDGDECKIPLVEMTTADNWKVPEEQRMYDLILPDFLDQDCIRKEIRRLPDVPKVIMIWDYEVRGPWTTEQDEPLANIAPNQKLTIQLKTPKIQSSEGTTVTTIPALIIFHGEKIKRSRIYEIEGNFFVSELNHFKEDMPRCIQRKIFSNTVMDMDDFAVHISRPFEMAKHCDHGGCSSDQCRKKELRQTGLQQSGSETEYDTDTTDSGLANCDPDEFTSMERASCNGTPWNLAALPEPRMMDGVERELGEMSMSDDENGEEKQDDSTATNEKNNPHASKVVAATEEEEQDGQASAAGGLAETEGRNGLNLSGGAASTDSIDESYNCVSRRSNESLMVLINGESEPDTNRSSDVSIFDELSQPEAQAQTNGSESLVPEVKTDKQAEINEEGDLIVENTGEMHVGIDSELQLLLTQDLELDGNKTEDLESDGNGTEEDPEQYHFTQMIDEL